MGCDIHSFAEVRRDGKWKQSGAVFPLDDFGQKWEKRSHTEHPFDWRSYGLFGFLANVRNYSCVPCIQEPTYELPLDVSDKVRDEFEDSDWHTINVLTLKQLLDFDYDQTFWDRRVTKEVRPGFFDGAALAEEGEGKTRTLRDFLGPDFFRDLDALNSLSDPESVRIVFAFDN